jgi:hypothetical protein
MNHFKKFSTSSFSDSGLSSQGKGHRSPHGRIPLNLSRLKMAVVGAIVPRIGFSFEQPH